LLAFSSRYSPSGPGLALYLDTLIAHGDRIPEDMHSTKQVSLGITVRTPIIA
jgi:hypothetical protein